MSPVPSNLDNCVACGAPRRAEQVEMGSEGHTRLETVIYHGDEMQYHSYGLEFCLRYLAKEIAELKRRK